VPKNNRRGSTTSDTALTDAMCRTISQRGKISLQDFIKNNLALSVNRELLKIRKSVIGQTKGEIVTLLLSLLAHLNEFSSTNTIRNV
jgi:hypothetical protein